METNFENIQKIWNDQQSVIDINEPALQQYIISGRSKALHTVNFTELLSILANSGSGIFILVMNLIEKSRNILTYALGIWMCLIAVYAIVHRARRLQHMNTFDRSVLGELRDALFLSSNQERLSLVMLWNLVPVGLFLVFALWEKEKSYWLTSGLLLFFITSFFAGRWEHRMYTRRKQKFEELLSKLTTE